METLTEAVAKPDHIPSGAVYDFDIRHDPALLANPHERFRQLLRDAPPVFWTPRNGGRWVVTGYQEILQVARNPAHFSNTYLPPEQLEAMLAMFPKDMRRIPQPLPITLDPPEHAKYRAPLQQSFSPKAALARKETIRMVADELIDAVIGEGHCDFIPTIAEPLPVKVFLGIMGLPESRLREFRTLVHEFMSITLKDPMEGAGMSRKVVDAMLGEIVARKNDPKEDLISLLWKTEIDGRPMTLDLMEDYAILLFIAGLDTVINGMGYAIRHLAQDPELQAELRANPDKIPNAVEEMLRRYSFVITMRRIAKDVEFGGWPLKAGEWLCLCLPGADLDPREFEAPERFDLNREVKPNLAFGAGVHRCLGSHLARVELEVLYAEVLSRLPPFRLDPDKPVKFHAGNIIAIDSLPIRWD